MRKDKNLSLSDRPYLFARLMQCKSKLTCGNLHDAGLQLINTEESERIPTIMHFTGKVLRGEDFWVVKGCVFSMP